MRALEKILHFTKGLGKVLAISGRWKFWVWMLLSQSVSFRAWAIICRRGLKVFGVLVHIGVR